MRRILLQLIFFVAITILPLAGQTTYLWVDQIIQDGRPIPHALIAVKQGRIASVERDFSGALPRGAIDLRQFTVVPLFFGLQDTIMNDWPVDAAVMDIPNEALSDYDPSSRELIRIFHPVSARTVLTAPFTWPLMNKVPLLYIQAQGADVSQDLAEALEWGHFTAEPFSHQAKPNLFRGIRKKEKLLDVLSGDRSLIIYLRLPAPLKGIPEDVTVVSRDTLFVTLSDAQKKRSNYVIFRDLRRYFACMDTLNRLPDGVHPLIENPVHWQEFVLQRQSTAFLSILWKNPAEYLEISSQYGGIFPGKAADMVFLSKNPIENGAEIVLIMRDGKFMEMIDSQ